MRWKPGHGDRQFVTDRRRKRPEMRRRVTAKGVPSEFLWSIAPYWVCNWAVAFMAGISSMGFCLPINRRTAWMAFGTLSKTMNSHSHWMVTACQRVK